LHSLAAEMGIGTDELLPGLYQSLRRIAHRHMRGERAGHSLNTTALVNEAWLKLAASYPDMQFPTERDFLALAGHLMRRVLTDHARETKQLKRGGDQMRLTYTEGLTSPDGGVSTNELVELDIALNRLEQFDPRQVQVVEMRYFAGFSIEETAELMNLSPATVKREWAVARAWLLNDLSESE
jgi:RNA polymerase sigma factor (TIGR02999 family)